MFIIALITHIVNLSFMSGSFPSAFKTAKVIPIYKSGDTTSSTNYRPISLLSSFSKIFERAMYNAIMQFMNQNELFYTHQYGFRPKHSTIHPVIQLLNFCATKSNNSQPEATMTILCDLSKAFDVLNHKILFEKLKVYGLRGPVLSWF